ncbi:MAG: hypothetical protein HZB91_10690 [Elusimicrobia bacterium]|nr:hypothetical protein [Elusimicrobiota bacterium]
MKKILLPCVVMLFASAVSAGPTLEEISASARDGLKQAGEFKPAMSFSMFAQQTEKPEARPLAQKGQTVTLRLSGHVWLRGNAFVPQGSNFASVRVAGSTTLYDQNGKPLNGYVEVSDYVSVFLNSDYVSAFARPYAYVSIYKDGKFLGSVRIDGSIFVTGWNRNGWLDLSGSGTVGGTLTYTEYLAR